MPKMTTRHAIIILLYLGFKPKFLIDKGVARATAYKYSAKIPQIKNDMMEILK